MERLKTLFGKGFKLGAHGLLAAVLAIAALGLATPPASAATVVVNTTTDQSLASCSSSCSLRDAVATAAPGDTVQIPAGHYVLTLGQMLIQKSLTLTGAGARTTIIDGNASSGIFIFIGIVNAELDDLSLVNGKSTSGAALGAVSFTPPALLALTIRRCTFANNVTSFQGGAIDLQLVDLTVEDSTFSNNHAATQSAGGAINSNQARGSIVNSTFSGNTAGVAGAVNLSGGPNALTLSLINNTFTANQATRALAGGIVTTVAQLTLSNNIIAGNVGGDCTLSSTSIVTDHNLDSDNTCHLTGPGDLPGTNPLLGPLADNGGPTDTHALLTGSPARDAGGNSTCPAADQRGVTRPQRGICDIGSVEMENVAPTLASNQASVTVNEGQTAANTGTVTDAENDTVTLSASVGSVINNGNGTWSWSFGTSDGPTQSQTVTITGNDGQGGTSTTTFALIVNNVAPTIVSVSNNGPVIVGNPATITVTATDPAGANDPLSYSFDCDNNGTFEIGPQAGNSASCTFATTGNHTVNVRVADDDGGVATGSTVVTVSDPCVNGAIGGIDLGVLPKYLFLFADGNQDANWQGASKGFAGNVAVDGLLASERTSGGVPYAGTIFTNDSSLGAWQNIVSKNAGQASASTGNTSLISNLKADLTAAFAQINSLPVTPGYESVSATSLNGLNTTDGVATTYVINVTSGFNVSSRINITGDPGDVFVLRWDTDHNFSNGYQGIVKFQSGGAIVPQGGLTPASFIHVAGDIAASGGGGNPPAPYPQGPRFGDGTGALISGGTDFHGGGFFTGYWLTTGDPSTGQTHSLSNGIFVGGWYTLSSKFSLTGGTSGVQVCPHN